MARAGLPHVAFADRDPDAWAAVQQQMLNSDGRQNNEIMVREVFGRLNTAAARPRVRELVERWRPDVVVREPFELATHLEAERLGLDEVQINIGLDSFLDWTRHFAEPLAEQRSVNGVQGLAAIPRWTTVPHSFDRPYQSSAVDPVRFCDPDAVRDGAWPRAQWWPADHGHPLVYVTFGSVAGGMPLFPRFHRAVLDLLADLPVRVLLTVGEAADPTELGPLPGNAHVERWCPQAEVLPHVAILIGHGGFGTTMGALAAGVPQIVLPLFSGDQFDNADRVHEVGAGVALRTDAGRDEHAMQQLPSLIREMLASPRFGTVAQALRAEIAALRPIADCSLHLPQ